MRQKTLPLPRVSTAFVGLPRFSTARLQWTLPLIRVSHFIKDTASALWFHRPSQALRCRPFSARSSHIIRRYCFCLAEDRVAQCE